MSIIGGSKRHGLGILVRGLWLHQNTAYGTMVGRVREDERAQGRLRAGEAEEPGFLFSSGN
jgi:hypothetical protein